MMGILDDLKAEEDKLRGIRAPRGEGAGHAFGKSKANKIAAGGTGKARPDIFAENMASEDTTEEHSR